jgi:hypothetical protein
MKEKQKGRTNLNSRQPVRLDQLQQGEQLTLCAQQQVIIIIIQISRSSI